MENGEDCWKTSTNVETPSAGQSTSRNYCSVSHTHARTLFPSASVDRGPMTPTTQHGSTEDTRLDVVRRQSVTANGGGQSVRAVRRTRRQMGVPWSRPRAAVPRWNSVDEMLVEVRASIGLGRFDAPAAKPTAPGTLATLHLTTSSNHISTNNVDRTSLESDDKVAADREYQGVDSPKTTANELDVSATVTHIDKKPVVARIPENNRPTTSKSEKV